MSLQSETVVTTKPLSKMVRYIVLFLVIFTGLFVYGYSKPESTEEVRVEVKL